MKLILIIILALTTLEVAAQNHLIGVKGGVNRTNVTSDFSGQTDHRLGVSGGIAYEYFLKQRFSIGADLIYNQRGFTSDLTTPTNEKITLKYNYDYLSVPVKAGYYNRTIKIFDFVKLGLIPSLLINAKTKTPKFDTNGKITGTETFNVTNTVSEFDLAGLVEIGGSHKIVDRLWITTSLMYQHSLTSISNPEYFSDIDIRHNGISLNIGLQWELKNK